MKKLLITISVFVILMCVNIYADETETTEISSETVVSPKIADNAQSQAKEVLSEKVYYFSDNQDADINEILNDPDASVENLLRAMIVLLKDLDIYVQFFVTLVFAIGLSYFVILKPIRYFLI